MSTPSPAARILVSNACSNEITAYPLGSPGDVAPLSPVTGLGGPSGIAVDANGKVYVANPGCDSITVYAGVGAGADARVATISGPDTGLTHPTGIAVDKSGNIYVVNTNFTVFSGNGESAVPPSIEVYAQGSTGDIKPSATITGNDTGLDFPAGIALDSKGNIYVANAANDTLTVYAAGSTGDAPPIATIGGSRTALDVPEAIALDSKGTIYVASLGAPFLAGSSRRGGLTAYPPGSNGNVSPIVEIPGSNTALDGPAGLALDAKGNIYVASLATPSIRSGAISIFRSGRNPALFQPALSLGPRLAFQPESTTHSA